jgi:small neutral amino acid transporter SnatA (MarC family)
MQEFLSSAAGTFLALFPIASPMTKVPIFGFFTLAIAVQLIASGTLAFIQQSAPGLLK